VDGDLQVAVHGIRRTAASRGTSRPKTARQTITPTEPSQNAAVISQRIADGGGFSAWTTPSSTAELARMTEMDTATTAAANPNLKASDARRRVVPPKDDGAQPAGCDRSHAHPARPGYSRHGIPFSPMGLHDRGAG
jgi:hypothetical protein